MESSRFVGGRARTQDPLPAPIQFDESRKVIRKIPEMAVSMPAHLPQGRCRPSGRTPDALRERTRRRSAPTRRRFSSVGERALGKGDTGVRSSEAAPRRRGFIPKSGTGCAFRPRSFGSSILPDDTNCLCGGTGRRRCLKSSFIRGSNPRLGTTGDAKGSAPHRKHSMECLRGGTGGRYPDRPPRAVSSEEERLFYTQDVGISKFSRRTSFCVFSSVAERMLDMHVVRRSIRRRRTILP